MNLSEKENLVDPEVVQMDPNAFTLTCWRRKSNSEWTPIEVFLLRSEVRARL